MSRLSCARDALSMTASGFAVGAAATVAAASITVTDSFQAFASNPGNRLSALWNELRLSVSCISEAGESLVHDRDTPRLFRAAFLAGALATAVGAPYGFYRAVSWATTPDHPPQPALVSSVAPRVVANESADKEEQQKQTGPSKPKPPQTPPPQKPFTGRTMLA